MTGGRGQDAVPSGAGPSHPDPADLAPLRRAIALAADAVDAGDLPFGAVLVGGRGSVLLERRNSAITGRDCTAHAETALARDASARYAPAELAGATLYASCEPCAMCAGAIYWAGIGRVVYAMGEAEVHTLLRERYGDDVLALPCRAVFAAGNRVVDVAGPFLPVEARVPHDRYLSRRAAES